MSDNERQDLAQRLASLETKVDEKWNSHDKRADERWADLMDKIHQFERKFESRACVEHGKLILENKMKIDTIEKWQSVVNWSVGVIYVALVGVAIKYILG